MPFLMKQHKGNRTGLVATCDVCGQEVEAGYANVSWSSKNLNGDNSMCHFTITCKDHDDRIKDDNWQDLDIALMYLLHNTKTNIKEASYRAKLLSEIM